MKLVKGEKGPGELTKYPQDLLPGPPALLSTHRLYVWHILRYLVTDMIQWVLTPAREVGWMGVPYPHFTDEKTNAKDIQGAFQKVN